MYVPNNLMPGSALASAASAKMAARPPLTAPSTACDATRFMACRVITTEPSLGCPMGGFNTKKEEKGRVKKIIR